ncbi:MAG: hypothetical protein HGA67_03930 [Candidatus Yonathbacteria bacterium]|nr:hypothetical protein [Candidatus Yonathbacteria bacterium]
MPLTFADIGKGLRSGKENKAFLALSFSQLLAGVFNHPIGIKQNIQDSWIWTLEVASREVEIHLSGMGEVRFSGIMRLPPEERTKGGDDHIHLIFSPQKVSLGEDTRDIADLEVLIRQACSYLMGTEVLTTPTGS